MHTFISGVAQDHCKVGESPIVADLKQFSGEAKFFRAYNYWSLYKLFGEVPIVTKELDIDDKELYASRSTRKETVDFILKDLDDAAAELPERSALSGGGIGRITKGAATALKARVALFEGTWGKSRATPMLIRILTVNAASTVMNSSQYTLFSTKGAQSYRYFFIEKAMMVLKQY